MLCFLNFFRFPSLKLNIFFSKEIEFELDKIKIINIRNIKLDDLFGSYEYLIL